MDDQEPIGELLADFLRQQGFDAEAARSGEDVSMAVSAMSEYAGYLAEAMSLPGPEVETARREILANSGTQFDPNVVDSFLEAPPQAWEDIRRRTLEAKRRAFSGSVPLVLT